MIQNRVYCLVTQYHQGFLTNFMRNSLIAKPLQQPSVIFYGKTTLMKSYLANTHSASKVFYLVSCLSYHEKAIKALHQALLGVAGHLSTSTR